MHYESNWFYHGQTMTDTFFFSEQFSIDGNLAWFFFSFFGPSGPVTIPHYTHIRQGVRSP